ncbi:hypothetical protein [Paraburkholderia sp. J11-2]|uniref:hypothetical protein n=1 Tax=Paraburkholderia sp. J11-2 TaxID=2805431 RepID=UPI002AB6F1BE|nr:hypothetical protein [Paraburkholderia sp. J11-2]
MNEFTPDDMSFACDLVLGLCVFLGLLVGGACLAFFIEFGDSAIDAALSVVRPVFQLIGG